MLTLFHNLFAWAPMGLPAMAFVFTTIVFIHELGHFLVARLFGVSVETFSIGFGSEIFGWTDKKGTRWKFSWLPLGGYVKFLGDENATSTTPDLERIEHLKSEERAHVLFFKPLYQRALVAAAGPAANFVLAFLIFFILLAAYGAKTYSTYVGAVQPHAPAAEAGLKPGDKITAVDGKAVRLYFGELQEIIRGSKGKTLSLSVERKGRPLSLRVTPRQLDFKDIFGSPVKSVAIGILPADPTGDNAVYLPVPLARVPLVAAAQCWGIVDLQLTYLWRIVSHHADASGLGGPIGIASVAKTAASQGLYDLINLVAFISVSIGLVNLFPIPLLDGGHLLYYGCEAVLGRPLNERTQEIGFKLGLALVLGLFIFAAWNDLVRLNS